VWVQPSNSGSSASARRPPPPKSRNPNQRFHRSKFVRGDLIVGAPLKIDWVEPEEIHGTSYYPKVLVRFRLNDANEVKEEWPAGSDKSSATFSKDWLKKMLRAQTVELTADDDRGSQVVMQFDMPDPTLIEQGCGVYKHKGRSIMPKRF
jgi:hypothetical protein